MGHNICCQVCGLVLGECTAPPPRILSGTFDEVAQALVRDDLPEDEEAAQAIQLAEDLVEDAELRACLDDRDHTRETSIFGGSLCRPHLEKWAEEMVETLPDDY